MSFFIGSNKRKGKGVYIYILMYGIRFTMISNNVGWFLIKRGGKMRNEVLILKKKYVMVMSLWIVKGKFC